MSQAQAQADICFTLGLCPVLPARTDLQATFTGLMNWALSQFLLWHPVDAIHLPVSYVHTHTLAVQRKGIEGCETQVRPAIHGISAEMR